MTSTNQAKIGASALARLFALAGATFVFVTFEVFPVGLLRDIADSLDVTAGQVGLLVSGYAIIAALATIPTVALATRVPRRTALVTSLVFLVAAEVLTVASTTFATVAASRFLAALTHGVVWSLVAPAAATLVPRERVGTATAVVFGGASLALILGSPGTTFIGGLIGWRATALVLTIATVAVTIAVFFALRTPAATGPASRTAPETTAQQQGTVRQTRGSVDWQAVLTLCGVSILLVTAHFISYTYFALIITEITGTARAVVVFLAIFGAAGAAGTFLVGRYLDIAARRAEVVTMTLFAAALAALSLSLLPAPPVISYAGATIAVAVWGLAFAATGPIFQTGILRIAAEDPDRASSVYVTGVQIGIASGSALGALLVSLSTVWLLPVSTLLAIAVLFLLLRIRPTRATARRASSSPKAGSR